jgi:uncharacterized membrane protein
MTLLPLIAGLVIFLGTHVFTTQRVARQALIGRVGPGPYKLGYTVVAAIGLALIIWGYGQYRAGGYIPVWQPPRWAAHVALPLMWLALIALAAAYLPGTIKRTLKHPMLVAIKIWCVAHLLANGHLGAIILFGSFLAFAVYDRIAVKRREAVEGPAPVRQGTFTNDLLAVGVGTVAFAAIIFWLHPALIGVAVWPG